MLWSTSWGTGVLTISLLLLCALLLLAVALRASSSLAGEGAVYDAGIASG